MGEDLLERELLENGERGGDRRIKMSTGDVADRVDHHHHYQTPCDAYSWERHRSIHFVHHHRPTSCEHHEERPDGLCQ